jgi:hypothetical protein
MEFAIAVILLAVGLILERTKGSAQPVRIRIDRRR